MEPTGGALGCSGGAIWGLKLEPGGMLEAPTPVGVPRHPGRDCSHPLLDAGILWKMTALQSNSSRRLPHVAKTQA